MRLDILLEGTTRGDAITDQALAQRDWLRTSGVQSDLFARYIHPSVADDVRPFAQFRGGKRPVIYHHSIDSEVGAALIKRNQPLILVYHNITPAHFFKGIDPFWEEKMVNGRKQIASLLPHVTLAFADSSVNAAELVEIGFTPPIVLPIHVEKTDNVELNQTLAQKLDGEDAVLFIGRFAPNKRQADLVKLFYHLKRVRPSARLYLVGDPWTVGYDRWTDNLTHEFDLRDIITQTGKVSTQDLQTYLHYCKLYLSMSEHEGFGKPLIESMVAGLPILAFAEPGVSNTLGDAGVQFTEKRYPELAELVDLILSDESLRERISGQQKERVTRFMAENVRALFLDTLRSADLL